MKVMVSACLLGENCKYNGGNNKSDKLLSFIDGHEVIPICPEVMGGLPTPREPGEIVNGVVKTQTGKSIDFEYHRGAELVLELAKSDNPDMVILQSRSPSCGVKQIYDGTFSGTKIPGMGVTAKLLKENGFKVVDVEDI